MTPYLTDIRRAASSKILWDKLHGKRILVAGSTGLIGTCLTRILMASDCGCHIYAMCRNVSKAHGLFNDYLGDGRFHLLEGDVTKPIETDIAFDYIIDAASPASPSIYNSDPISVVRGNIYGVDNLLSYGVGHDMKRFLYVSSGEIYGEGDGKAFEENDSGYVNCLSPRACYPSSKRAAETLASAYISQYGVDAVIVRPCHVYGPEFSNNDNRVYAEFLKKVASGKDIILKSAGSQYRSWCYVVDCAVAMLYVLIKGKKGEAYNVADENSNMTIRELAELAASFSKSRVVFENPSASEVKSFNPVQQSTLSTAKLKALGWMPLNDMKTSVLHCICHLNEISYISYEE